MPAAIVVGAVLAEVVLALSIADPRFSRLLLLFAGATGLILVFAFPFAAACVLMALFGSVELGFLVAPLGPIDGRAYEIVLGALLVVAVVRPVRQTWGGRAGGAWGCFFAFLIVATLSAVAAGALTPTQALPWARPFFLYAFFFVIVRLFPDRRTILRLLTIAAICGAVSGVVAALIATQTGFGALLDFGAGSNTGAGETTSGGGPERVRLPGVGLAYGLFWFALLQLIAARGAYRLGWSLIFGGMALNIAVSQNRNMWLGLAVGLALLLVLSGSGVRHKVLVGGTVLVLGVVLMFTFGSGLEENARFAPILERGTTLFDPNAVGQESSLIERGNETEAAWAATRGNLLLGIGPGTDFGVSFGEKRTDGTYRSATQRFLHNQYLYLLMIGGVPLLLSFLAFLTFSLNLAAHRRDPVLTSLAVGVFAIMVSAIVMISFSSYDMIGALAMLAGAVAALGLAPPAEVEHGQGTAE